MNTLAFINTNFYTRTANRRHTMRHPPPDLHTRLNPAQRGVASRVPRKRKENEGNWRKNKGRNLNAARSLGVGLNEEYSLLLWYSMLDIYGVPDSRCRLNLIILKT